MGNLKQFESGNSAIVQKPDGSPEGKGVNGVRFDWHQSKPRGVVAKPQRQLLAEFFTSMLVLSATFKFRPVSGAIGRFYDAFAEMLNTDLTLEEILPFYVARAPYYQRLYASALSRSVRAAVTLGDQASTSWRQWRMLLPQLKSILLTHRG